VARLNRVIAFASLAYVVALLWYFGVAIAKSFARSPASPADWTWFIVWIACAGFAAFGLLLLPSILKIIVWWASIAAALILISLSHGLA